MNITNLLMALISGALVVEILLVIGIFMMRRFNKRRQSPEPGSEIGGGSKASAAKMTADDDLAHGASEAA